MIDHVQLTIASVDVRSSVLLLTYVITTWDNEVPDPFDGQAFRSDLETMERVLNGLRALGSS